MEGWLKLFVFVMPVMFLIPFALTEIILFSSRDDNGQKIRKKQMLTGTALNLIGNGIAVYGVCALLFHTRRAWSPLKRIFLVQCSWQDVGSLALAIGICAVIGLLLGLILRRCFFREGFFSQTGRPKTAVLGLMLIATAVTLAGCEAARQGVRQLKLTEICRKTTVFAVDPQGREKLGGTGREISFAVISNPGALECKVKELYLSETEDDLRGIRFSDISVPAYGCCRLTTDFNHGLDLDKKGNSYVYLSDGSVILDQVQVPALEEDTSWRFTGEDGQWEMFEYVKKASPGIATPQFSRESGFYSEGFDLTISAPEGQTILYTTDGSDPTIHGLPYTGSIRIEDRTPSENNWSARTDVSATFLEKKPRYTVPDYPVDKCTVIRAVCKDGEGNAGRTATESYFVGYENRKGYEQIGVISLVTDPDNLFDDETGIYVLGDAAKNESSEERKEHKWWWWEANYHYKGRLWEREANILFFDADHQMILSKDIGIRIKGDSSAGLLPKGWNLYARTQYDNDPLFRADLFQNGYEAQKLSLSAGGNDVTLKIKDWLTMRLTQELDTTHTHFIPYCMFLNGEYWGNYWLTERHDELFFSFAYQLAPENIIAIKNGDLEAGVGSDMDLYDEMISQIADHDMSLPEAYETVCHMVDINDFALFYAVEMYVANRDYEAEHNSLVWRTREPEDSEKGDALWRCALFDLNHQSCYKSGKDETLNYLLENDRVFRSLMNNTDFANRFYSALERLAREYFAPERAEEALTEYLLLMKEPMEQEHRRFNRNITDFSALDSIRDFLRSRQEYILNLCEAYKTSTK